MSKVLVTGGAGFIGSNLVDRLLDEGHSVTVIDNESSMVHESFFWNVECENVQADVRDFSQIEKYFAKVDFVFHMAGQSRIQPSITAPLDTISTNVMGTANVLEASRLHGVQRVIYSTTSSYYGVKNSTPNVETQPEDCLNPYSLSKVTGDKLCKLYSDLYKLETVILRYFCVYGKNEPLKGEYAPVIGLFLRQFQEGKPLTVIGDGQQIRDFTHIEDVVEANYVSMTSTRMGTGETYNVGSGKSLSILEIAGLISDNIVFLPPRPAEARASMADTSKIKSHYGWSPKKNLRTYIQEQLKANLG